MCALALRRARPRSTLQTRDVRHVAIQGQGHPLELVGRIDPHRGARRVLASVLLAVLGLVGIVTQVSASDECGPDATAVDDGAGGVQCIHVDERDVVEMSPESLAGLVAAEEGGRDETAGQTLAASEWYDAASRRTVELVCDTSSDRHRVQVVYVHAGSSRLGSERTTIEQSVALAQSQFDRSSQVHGSSYALIPRFVASNSRSGCTPDIKRYQTSASLLEPENYGRLIGQMRSRGYDDLDRTYLLMIDVDPSISGGYCGIATYAPGQYDPRPEVNENNNRRSSAFAGVFKRCWYDLTVAHELAHTFGAVQWIAPNATDRGHCTDGRDTLCYRDGGRTRSGSYTTSRCPGAEAEFVLDCKADDYFDPSGKRFDHWNIADSDWLLGTPLRSWSRGGAVGASGTRFSDVRFTNVFGADISALADTGITKGCNSRGTQFCPDESVSRQQMAAFITNLLDLPPGDKRFADVPADSKFLPAIQAMARAGITDGCNSSGTRFCPKEPVKRQHMAKFLTEALDLPAGSATFRDVPRDSSFRGPIAALAKAGITDGCKGGRDFCPRDDVSREQMAKFLMRATRFVD